MKPQQNWPGRVGKEWETTGVAERGREEKRSVKVADERGIESG